VVGIADGTPGSGVDEDARGEVANNGGGPGSTRVGWAEAGRRRPSRPPCRRRHKGASAAMRLRASQSQLNAPAPVSGRRWAVPPPPAPLPQDSPPLAGLLPHRCSAPCLPPFPAPPRSPGPSPPSPAPVRASRPSPAAALRLQADVERSLVQSPPTLPVPAASRALPGASPRLHDRDPPLTSRPPLPG
jgi:hypothetical protein